MQINNFDTNRNIETVINFIIDSCDFAAKPVCHNMSVVSEGNIGKYSMSIDFSQTLDLGFNYIQQTVYIFRLNYGQHVIL